MFKKMLIMFCLLALTGTAFGAVDIPVPTQAITVTLTIDPYTQVLFQDDSWVNLPDGDENDIDIIFSNTVGVDYHSPVLIGQYFTTDGISGSAGDGWATGYFESKDGATIWMQSNHGIDGSLATSGDLDNGTNTLPTWFTIAVNGYDGVGNDPNGFRLGNSGSGTGWVMDGLIPGGVPGGYAGDGVAGGNDVSGPVTFAFGAQDFWPTQDAFQMSTATGSNFDLDAPVGPGTMKFLARVLRSGVHDVSGVYTATITPTWTVAP